jgi:glycosyltransferase involved in cell wall biosynthesis
MPCVDPAAVGSLPRVLIVHPAMAPYRTDLFNALACRCTLRVLFLNAVPPYDENLRREDLAAELTCNWSVLADDYRSPAWALPRRLFGEASSFKPDVVVTHEFGWASSLSTLTPLASRHAARVLWTTRSADQFDQLTRLRRAAVRCLAPLADAMLAYSDASRERLAAVARVSKSRIFVCANHQDAGRLRRLAASASDAVLDRCQSLGISSSRLVVTVGRLVAIKDVATTIQAFATAFGDTQDTSLVIVGDGPLRRDLERSARDAGIADRVLFVGHVPAAEVQAWLSLASLNVLASHAEPFGAVVAEGLAHGVPCLCSKVAGAAVLINDISRGATFSPGDVKALAEAMRVHAAAMRTVAVLAEVHRDDLRPLSVEDDAAGFCSAVAFAVAARRGLVQSQYDGR